MTILSANDALSRADLVFVDTRKAALWAEETIAGARQLSAYDYFISESTPEGVLKMVAGLKAAFAELGLAPGTQVVFFEDETGMISPRALWFHELCGFENGMILDGGLRAWIAAGGATAKGEGDSVTIRDGEAAQAGTFKTGAICDLAEAVQATRAAPATLLDTRDPPEWTGAFAHTCCARKGRLPNSLHLFYEDVLSEGRYRSPDELRAVAAKAGLQPDARVIAYCHRGARAANVYYALRAAGFTDLTLYTGGWHEWSNRPELAITSDAVPPASV